MLSIQVPEIWENRSLSFIRDWQLIWIVDMEIISKNGMRLSEPTRSRDVGMKYRRR